jgi:hypothetical protein
MRRKTTRKQTVAAVTTVPKKDVRPRKPSPQKKRKEPLTNARLLELAPKRKPPQSWYDEDFDGIG